MKLKQTYLLVFLIFVAVLTGFSQQKLLDYRCSDKPVADVLDDISKNYQVKFAYDPQEFSKIRITLSLKKSTTDELLKILNDNYSIKSGKVENTWVLVYSPPLLKPVEVSSSAVEKKSVLVSGNIKDGSTGEYLLYCSVLYGTDQGTMTNNLGFFSFSTQQPENSIVKILISHLGYQRLDTVIQAGKPATIYLKPARILMEDIVVKQVEKNILEVTNEPGKIGFNPVKSSNFPRIAEDDMVNAMLIIPGVSFLQSSMAGLSIRGSAPTDNLILLDGIPVLETSHLLGNMSVLNSKYIHQAFVSRGGYDAEFGGRVSGLIELIGESGKNSGPYIDISANLLNTNLLANLPVTKKLSVTAAWRRSFIDQWQNYLYKRLVDGVQTENNLTSVIYPSVKYQDVNANVSFHPSDKLEFNLNALYGTDFQDRDYTLVNTDEYYRTERATGVNKGFSFNWNWQVAKRWHQSLTASYSDLKREENEETGALKEYTLSANYKPNQNGRGNGVLKTQDKTYEAFVNDVDNGNNKVEEYRLTWKTSFETGMFRNQAGIGWSENAYQFSYFANRTDAQYPVDSITGKATQFLLNGFVQQHLQITSPLKLRWGLHTNFDLQKKKFYWQPRAGAEFSPLSGLKIHYAFGVYYQFLSTAKRIDSEGHFSQVWYLPDNEGLGLVKGVHHITGFTFEKNGWLINTEGYYKTATGKINLLAEPVYSGDGRQIKYFPRKTDERSRGVDFFIQKKHANFNYIIGYSLSKVEERTNEIFDGRWIPAYNDRLHQLKLNEMFTWKTWTITGSWHFGTGLPMINLADDNSLTEIERSDNFSQLDFAVVRKFHTRHFSANAGVSLLNVLNRKNVVEVDYLRFSSEYGSLTVRSDVSALGFTPLFFINFKFQ